MRHLWIGAAVLCGAWGTTTKAEAATKIPPCLIAVLEQDVPETARFVVSNERANELQSQPLLTDGGRKLELVVRPLDMGYSSVTVRAKKGESYPFVPGSRCNKDRLVVAGSKGPTESASPKLTLGIDEWGGLFIDWGNDTHDGETRVDWAYSLEELEAGNAHTEIFSRWKRRYRSRHHINVARGVLDSELIYLHITRYRSDGRSASWKGWAYKRADGRLAIGHGRLPAAPAKRFSAATRCPSPRVVDVPPSPTLYRYDTSYLGLRQFGIIETRARTPLEVERKNLREVAVDAPEGTVFRVDSIPRHPCPTWLRASSQARPTFQVERLIELSSFGGPADHYEFDLSHHLHASANQWPLFESKWSPTLEGLSKAKGKIQEPQNLSFTNMQWGESVHVAPGLLEYYVEVTPQWRQTSARVPVRGKIRIEINNKRRVAHFEPL